MGGAQLVVLSENCDQGDYKKLIEALCHEKNVNLMTVPDKMQLASGAACARSTPRATPRRWSSAPPRPSATSARRPRAWPICHERATFLALYCRPSRVHLRVFM